MPFTFKQAERDSRDVKISNRPTTKREYYLLYYMNIIILYTVEVLASAVSRSFFVKHNKNALILNIICNIMEILNLYNKVDCFNK